MEETIGRAVNRTCGGALAGFDVQARKIFGSPVYFVKENMFAGVYGEGIMLHLRPEDQTGYLLNMTRLHLLNP